MCPLSCSGHDYWMQTPLFGLKIAFLGVLMEYQVLDRILTEAVSLFVLSAVLFGMYKLTNRFIDVMSEHVGRFADSLERIADVLESQRAN